MTTLRFLIAVSCLTISTAQADPVPGKPTMTAQVDPGPVAPAPVAIVGAPDVAQAALALKVPADPARAAAALHAADSALHQLQQLLGIPLPQALPPAFYATTAGKVIIWTSFGFGVASSVAAPLVVAFQPRAR